MIVVTTFHAQMIVVATFHAQTLCYIHRLSCPNRFAEARAITIPSLVAPRFSHGWPPLKL